MIISILIIYLCILFLSFVVVKAGRYYDLDLACVKDEDLKEKSDFFCAFSMSCKVFLSVTSFCLFILAAILSSKSNDSDDYTDTGNPESLHYNPEHKQNNHFK